MSRLALPSVTLCAASSVNVLATAAALEACLEQADFAQSLLLTDKDIVSAHPSLQVVTIPPIQSTAEYSSFILNDLINHIQTDQCLIVQWDGFILDAGLWDPAFLSFDYIGAPWPQFHDGHNVGNGGFSLRSRRLLAACGAEGFRHGAAEDKAICRVNRSFLECQYGLRFADGPTAGRFAFERSVPDWPTFGFHGIFNMIRVLGPDRFWEVFSSLDDPSSAFIDYGTLIGQLGQGHRALRRRLELTLKYFGHSLGLKR